MPGACLSRAGDGYRRSPQPTTSERIVIAAPGGTPPTFRHEAALFDRDEDLVALVEPFLAAGIARDEPTILAVGPTCAARLTTALEDPDDLIVVPETEAMRRPAVRLQTLRRTIDVHLAAGADGIRLVSALPVDPAEDPALAWQPWGRFEAYLEVAFAGVPLRQLCLYDRRTAGPRALASAARCHHRTLTAGDGHEQEGDRPEPSSLLRSLLLLDEPATGPGAPAAELVDPSPGAARRLVGELAAGLDLDVDDADGLVAATSEIVTNAHLHGRAPVLLCAWRDPHQLVVAVTDHGDGPSDPTVGLAPAERGPGEGGFGLWIAHQVCHAVTLHRADGAFTVRMVARTGNRS